MFPPPEQHFKISESHEDCNYQQELFFDPLVVAMLTSVVKIVKGSEKILLNLHSTKGHSNVYIIDCT